MSSLEGRRESLDGDAALLVERLLASRLRPSLLEGRTCDLDRVRDGILRDMMVW